MQALELEMSLPFIWQLVNLSILNFFVGKMDIVIVAIPRVAGRSNCRSAHKDFTWRPEHSKSLIATTLLTIIILKHVQ